MWGWDDKQLKQYSVCIRGVQANYTRDVIQSSTPGEDMQEDGTANHNVSN